MMHQYRPLWRGDRSRRPAPATNAPTPVTWIVAALFAFILIYAFVTPIARHLMEQGQ